jgi:hypothetical protein
MPLDPGYIMLNWTEGEMAILLGEGNPSITQGYSRFEETPRPKRSDVVQFVGGAVFKQTIPLMFDGFIEDRSVERECSIIEGLAVSRGVAGEPPAVVRVSGPVPHSELEWYIESIEWGDAIYEGNNRTRQIFTLNLIQRLDLPYVLMNETRRVVHPPKGWKVVVTKTGDLRELAQIMLNNSALWRRFTDTKGKKFRDWRVKKGTRVRVPR